MHSHSHTNAPGRHEAGYAGHHHAAMIADFRRRFWTSLVLTVPVIALSPMIQAFLGLQRALAFPGDGCVLFALSSGIFFYGGSPFLKGLKDELASRQPGMMTLIALAVSVAYFYSSAVVFGLTGRVFYWELATLIDVMLLGHWIEMKSIMGASGALEALVKPGEQVPTDGTIVKGRTSLNESMLTGESKPVSKGEGDEAIGASINAEGAITLEIEKTGDETSLSQVIDMVRKAQASRSRTRDQANRAAQWLTYIALSAGAGTDVAVRSADVVLVRSDPRDVIAVTALSRATYGKMIQNLLWATGYNTFAIPLAAGVTYSLGFVLSPAIGAALMSLSTVIVAINAKLLGHERVPT